MTRNLPCEVEKRQGLVVLGALQHQCLDPTWRYWEKANRSPCLSRLEHELLATMVVEDSRVRQHHCLVHA